MKTEIITDFNALNQLASAWHRLWELDPQATSFARFGWARAMWQAYGRGRELCTPVVRHGDEVVGILPLVLEAGTLRFIGDPRADYNDMLCHPEHAAAAVEAAFTAIASAGLSWQRWVLRNVPTQSNVFPHLDRIRTWTKHRVGIAGECDCPQVDLRENGEALLKDILRKKSLNRHEKELAKRGRLGFRHLETREEIQRHLPTFYRQHIARWAMADQASLFFAGEARAFYEAIVVESDPRRELRFAVVELDGQPIAYHLGFEAKGVLVWYKPSFDVAYWQHSPGEVLLKRLFEHVRDQRLWKFDFTVGDESFKSRFANVVARNVDLELCRPGWRGGLRWLLLRARGSLRRAALRSHFARRLWDLSRSAGRPVGGTAEGGRGSRWLACVGAVWREFVFSRSVAESFAQPPPLPVGAAPDVTVRPTLPNELCQLAEAGGAFDLGAVLRAWREGLRSNGRLFTAWADQRLIRIAIVGSYAPASAAEGQEDLQGRPTPVSGPLLLGYWLSAGTPPGVIDRTVCALLHQQTGPADADYRANCPAGAADVRRALEHAGFTLEARTTTRKLLGRYRWSRTSRTRPGTSSRPA